MKARIPFAFCALLATSLAACGGGSAGPGSFNPAPAPNPTPTPGGPPITTQQVVTMALPSTAIGTIVDPVFGAIGGYTQALYSQTLAFAPGSQIMVRNGQASSTPHTLSVVSTSAPPGFVAAPNPPLSATAAGGSTLGAGFSTGTVTPGTLVGPFTLASGTYWVGCAFHYDEGMRTAIVVAANATPGPQATPAPGKTAPPPGNGY